MAVRLVFLGRLQDLAGGEECTLPFDWAASVRTLIAALDPALARELGSPRIRVAVNGVLASVDAVVIDGDEIAFLPPVSGG